MHLLTRILGLSLFLLAGCGSGAPEDAGPDTARDTGGTQVCSCSGSCGRPSADVIWPADQSCAQGACDGISNFNCPEDAGPAATVDAGPPAPGVVQVVLFVHIEDNTPPGTIGSPMSRTAYLRLRSTLLALGARAARLRLRWVLQPDWSFLEAARVYEDAAVTADTGGANLLVHLRDVLGVAIDPHSHENGGYNYTDVAYLLEQLGVGGTTVIGGHIWDPSLPQFQAWDRFRVPVAGEHYPTAMWRGDILIGAGTPNHVNDPRVSGVWRPLDRDHFFTDDPAGNIVVVGAWEGGIDGVRELVALHASGAVPADRLLTASWNIPPNTIAAPGSLDTLEASTLAPLAELRDAGLIEVTDFTAIVDLWRARHGARASIWMP